MLARHEAFGIAAKVHIDAVAVDALDDAGYERADAILVFLDDLRALGLAHFLHDDLLGGLGADAAERDRFHRHFDETVDHGSRVDVDRVIVTQFAFGELQFSGVIGKDLPAPECLVFAGLAVDFDAHVDVLAVLAARG